MKFSILSLFILLSSIQISTAQITAELLASTPTLDNYKDYDCDSLKENSDQLEKYVTLSDADGKEFTCQVIAKINLNNDWYLITFSKYYEKGSDYIEALILRKYDAQSLEAVETEPIWLYTDLFVHSPEFTETNCKLRFEDDIFVVNNEIESIKLMQAIKIDNDYELKKEELLINLDEFPDLPLEEEIDIYKMIELINTSKAETFCNIDGYCQFNVVGKVQGEKFLHIFLGYNYNLEDEYEDYYSFYLISIKGKDLKGWINPSNWLPESVDGIDSFKVSSDKKRIIIKAGDTIVEEPIK